MGIMKAKWVKVWWPVASVFVLGCLAKEKPESFPKDVEQTVALSELLHMCLTSLLQNVG